MKRNIVTKLELLTPQGLYFLGCIKGYFFKGYSIERDRGWVITCILLSWKWQIIQQIGIFLSIFKFSFTFFLHFLSLCLMLVRSSFLQMLVESMAVRVVEFSNGVYKIRKIFTNKSTYAKGNYWILRIGLTGSLSSLQKSEVLKFIILTFHVKKLDN